MLSLLLSVIVRVSIAIALSVVPFLVDCCISPHCHCCCHRYFCHLAAAMAVAIAATAAVAFAVTAAEVITAAINASSQRMASARGFSACLSALALIAWLS